MARWVLPVLVGPSTAVTPAPRARASDLADTGKEIGIKGSGWAPPPGPSAARGKGSVGAHLYHNMTLERAVLKVWNESGTNRGRIGDSRFVRIRSRDIWRRSRDTIPDRVPATYFAVRIAAETINGVPDQDSAASQELPSCGLRGHGSMPAKADRRRSRLTASSPPRWTAADAQPRRIASLATRRARSASAPRSGKAPGSAFPRSAPSRPRRHARR